MMNITESTAAATLPFHGFEQQDFATFLIEGLEPRMAAIRERIQPKFQAIGLAICDDIAALSGGEMFVHIAKHARRTTNAPRDTWMAFSPSKKGYKMYPHFQIGLFDDHLFLWLALIYELPNKRAMATQLLQEEAWLRTMLPEDAALSFDHMKKDYVRAGDLTEEELHEALIRFRDVKKTELLIGRRISSEDPLLRDGGALLAAAKDIFASLMPIYQMVGRASHNPS